MDAQKHRKKTTQNATLSMDIESHETDGLLKKRAPKRQGLAFKLAILLCGLVRDDCRLNRRRPDCSIELPGGTGGCSGHRSRERREVGLLRNLREARGVAGRRRGTDHRSVAGGRAPFDVVSLSID